MTEIEATQAIYAAIRTGWTASVYTFEGEHFSPPMDDPWIRVTIRDQSSRIGSLGTSGLSERRGLLIAQCFAPIFPDDGVGSSVELAHTFRRLFERTNQPNTPGSDPVHFLVGTVTRIGVDGSWFNANASIPFLFLDTQTS